MTYAYRLLPGGYVDETGVHRGVPPTQEDLDRIELLTLHRRLLFGPYDAEFTQEMPIAEAKKRWPENFEKEKKDE